MKRKLLAGEPDFVVRPVTREDLDALASLRPWVHDKHARAHPENFKLSNHEAARREAEDWLGQADVRVLIATLDGEPTGYLRTQVFERPESEFVYRRRILYIDQMANWSGLEWYYSTLTTYGRSLGMWLTIGLAS